MAKHKEVVLLWDFVSLGCWVLYLLGLFCGSWVILVLASLFLFSFFCLVSLCILLVYFRGALRFL